MATRSLLLRSLRAHRLPAPIVRTVPKRLNSSTSTSTSKPETSTATTTTLSSPSTTPGYEKSWLTRKVESSPRALAVFLAFAKALGYGSPKQQAARRAFAFYEDVCAVKPDQDKDFWQQDCYMPPTFQTWFTITNLHVWMLTVRLRALPEEHGKHYIQALLDHFFIDVEDRIRNVLQPTEQPKPPYTFHTDFYVNPNARKGDEHLTKRVLSRAPDRIVNRQMKIFKEQWGGLGMSFDLAVIQSDMEMAGAIWRNILGARGAQGIDYSEAGLPKFRRAVNLVGGEVVNVAKLDLEKEETTDDGSGVHDFPPAEVDKYLTYPTVMYDLTTYIRRELERLERVSDQDILYGDWEKLKFGRVDGKKAPSS